MGVLVAAGVPVMMCALVTVDVRVAVCIFENGGSVTSMVISKVRSQVDGLGEGQCRGSAFGLAFFQRFCGEISICSPGAASGISDK